MFTNSKYTFRIHSLKWLSLVWVISIVAPLIYFPGPSLLVGHPWKVELIISFILFGSLITYIFFQQRQKYRISNSAQILKYTIIPCGVFILWSAVSILWADSTASVLHHTLIWSCYLTFFLFALIIVSDRKLLKISLFALGSVMVIICICCIAEVFFGSKFDESFRSRYSRFAEIFAAILPLFISFVVRLNRKHLVGAVVLAVLLWLGILFSMSRGAFLSAVIGLLVFYLLRIFTKKNLVEKRRLIFASLGIIFIVLMTQTAAFFQIGEQTESTFSRIATQYDENSANSNSVAARVFFAGVGKEMFFANYITGVGADNFGLEFNKYSAVFSEKPENKSIAQQPEGYLSERAHNEYLQILAELGVVGTVIFLSLLFGIAKLGFAEVIKNRFERSNILTHAAIGGIVAFLVSSAVSSYSFRLMQNGLVFFFLLAILLRNCAIEKNQEKGSVLIITPKLKLVFGSMALLACLSLTVFSSLKAASQYFVYRAEREKNFETAKSYYATATFLDSANASSDFSYGLRLFNEGDYQESGKKLNQAIQKGVNDSVSYTYLISAQTLAKQPQQAVNTASEALKIFPYSVFLRVRYAALINNFNEKNEAVNQLKIAEQLNERQAKTWWILINEGSLRASEKARANKEIASLDELLPNQGLYAVLAERQITHPEEKMIFNF